MGPLGSGNPNRVCICPTWDERERKPTATGCLGPQPAGSSPCPAPHTIPPLSVAQRRLHTAFLQGPSGPPMGRLGFRNWLSDHMTNLQSSSLKHTLRKPSKQAMCLHASCLKTPQILFPGALLFFLFHQSVSQTFSSFLLGIPSFSKASCLLLPACSQPLWLPSNIPSIFPTASCLLCS